MKIRDLKEMINQFPDEFDDCDLVNGEYGTLVEDGENKYFYRRDISIRYILLDEDTKEMVFCHQTEEEIKTIEAENE